MVAIYQLMISLRFHIEDGMGFTKTINFKISFILVIDNMRIPLLMIYNTDSTGGNSNNRRMAEPTCHN